MMLEQTQKIFKSPAIQKLMQVQKDFIERMKKTGYYDNSERMQELMLPTAFLNIPLTKEDEQAVKTAPTVRRQMICYRFI